MIAGTIWKSLIATLGTPDLKYIKYIYQGYRVVEDANSLPCIMLEPTQNGQPERRVNNVDDQYFNVDLYAFSSRSDHNFEKAIVGDNSYKGVLDVEQDIRAVLKSSNSLGGDVIDVRIQPTVFDVLDTTKHPVRGFVMPLQILYRQVDGL